MDIRQQTFIETTRRDEDSQGIVTQAMGPNLGPSSFRQSNESSIILQPEQTLLLTTDGFTRYIDKGKITISQILELRQKYARDEQAFVKSLINLSNFNGGHDNITIISIPYQHQKTP